MPDISLLTASAAGANQNPAGANQDSVGRPAESRPEAAGGR